MKCVPNLQWTTSIGFYWKYTELISCLDLRWSWRFHWCRLRWIICSSCVANSNSSCYILLMLFIHFTNGGQYWHYRLQRNPAMNPPSFLMYGTECRTHFKTYLNNIFIYKNSYKQDKYRQMTEVCICVTKKVPQCIYDFQDVCEGPLTCL